MAQSNALQKHQSTQAANDAKTSKCKTPCCEGKGEDDKISEQFKAIRKAPPTPECARAGIDLIDEGQRFDKYRDALPYAKAAFEMNELGDDATQDDDQECLTRIPAETDEDIKNLNKKLGLDPGTITKEMMRNDETGFRAGLFRDDATGKVILVARDTQPNSLVDWETNINNGKGDNTPQYEAMRDLTKTLKKKKVSFDIAGYSKGGGMAQEAGLIATDAQVRVFNSAGIHKNSLGRTGGAKSFDGLIKRTKSFSSDGEFLTHMNNTADPQQQINNAIFLREQLAGTGPKIFTKGAALKLNYKNPAMKESYLDYVSKKEKASSWWRKKVTVPSNPDPEFLGRREKLLTDMTTMIGDYRQQLAANTPFQMFPPVRSSSHETIVNSRSTTARAAGSGAFDANELNTTKLIQHQMSAVLDPMKKSVEKDRKALKKFVQRCGKK